MINDENVPDLQPTLVGERVIIRPLVEADWEGLFRAASDPLVWEVHPCWDRYQEPVFRAFFDEAMAMATRSAFAIVDTASGDIIGSSRYYGYDPALREIEIGWTFLARAYWGGSYNAEIKRLMLDHAFSSGFVDVVIFVVGEGNLRSQRAMEKIGGVLRPGTVDRTLHGKTYRHVVYEIRRP